MLSFKLRFLFILFPRINFYVVEKVILSVIVAPGPALSSDVQPNQWVYVCLHDKKKMILDKTNDHHTFVWVSMWIQLPLGPCAGSGLVLMGVLPCFWWGFPRVWHQHQIPGQSYHGNTLKPGFHNTALPSASLHPSTALSKLPPVH